MTFFEQTLFVLFLWVFLACSFYLVIQLVIDSIRRYRNKPTSCEHSPVECYFCRQMRQKR